LTTSRSVTFRPSGLKCALKNGETVLQAARSLGIPIDAACGGQGVCGKCKFQAISGRLSDPSKEELEVLTPEELASGHRLACMSRPDSDLEAILPEESLIKTRAISPGRTPRTFQLEPALKNYYVELKEPAPGDSTADMERLLAGLNGVYGLDGLTVSYPVVKDMPAVLRQGGWKVTATVRHDREVTRLVPGYAAPVYGAAFDVGTTTVAGYLLELSSGKTIAADAILNPQAAFGADVMSRITYASTHEDGLAEMRAAIVSSINGMLSGMARAAGLCVEDVMEVAVAGNTTMHHILLGLPVVQLGAYPFTPALSRMMEVPAAEAGIGINRCGYVVALPLIAGFVGSDCVAAIIVEEPYRRSGATLIIDAGTNGELALSYDDRLLTASCATGPAFEGAQIRSGMRASEGAIERVVIDPETLEPSFKVIGEPGWSGPGTRTGAAGICGSGIIDAVARMYGAGILNRDGSFDRDAVHQRVVLDLPGGPEYVLAWPGETAARRRISVSQDDVRAVQLAKAALHAGARVLMREMGISRPDRIVLAGAFGNYIDKSGAYTIGMLPDCDLDEVYPVGNAAGDGAVAALLSTGKRAEAREVAAWASHVELSLHPAFQEEFLSAMSFREI
jgi:uncharacterized 2Fe-2S/4Fe-4S cluster protein (DUF4445 family)